MAFSFACNTEMDNNLPFDASFISMGDSAPQIVRTDEKLVNSPTYTCSTSPSLCGRARPRTFSQEDASTSSGDEDFVHSMMSSSAGSKGSDVSDDDKSLSPRSSVGDAASCVYSVILLLQFQAAHFGCARVPGQRSVLGYGTELTAETGMPLQCTTKPGGKPRKALKQLQKRVLKSHHASQAFMTARSSEPLQKPALPESAENSWVARQRAKTSLRDDDSKVIRAICSILNKLTMEKFESLFNQLVECGIKTPHHISVLMRELFEKATTQHHFIPMYAELCVRLAKNSRIASAAGDAGHLHHFRGLLLDQCQNVFEQLLQSCDAESRPDEMAVAERKKRALGNIKLIGELVVQGMLRSTLLVECGNMLLESRLSCPEALECLAALLSVAGGKFDTEEWQGYSSLQAIFSHMDALTVDKSVPTRVRFLLRDVLDVRSAGWCTSANQTALKAAPMKLDEVREKALQEQGVLASQKRQPLKNVQPPMNTQGKLSVAEACRALLGGSRAPGNDEAHTQTRQVRQSTTQKKKSCQNVATTSSAMDRLASVIARNHTSGGLSRDATQSCNKAEVARAVTPAVPVNVSNVNLPEKQVALQMDVPVSASAEDFDLVSFRRELAATLSALATDRSVPAAVQRIRSQAVPVAFQADQFVDIISRIVEERRGAVRRCELAFAAGLMVADHSPFDKKACFEGIRLFFEDVYTDMCSEVQRLPAIVKSELLPTMSRIFSASELNSVLPEDLQIA